MSEGNGFQADDGTRLVAPITSIYALRAQLDEALGNLADAERRAETAERRLAELRRDCRAALADAGNEPLVAKLDLVGQLEALRAPR